MAERSGQVALVTGRPGSPWTIPVGRLADADEIARVVEFLADPDSAFITGQIYSVTGGQYM
jgi:NAD(P)-dependent dehydrogenase (short-subunit alcohol dehydrogenase family)